MSHQDSPEQEVLISALKHDGSADLAALFDGHIAKEFADHDVNATMETMVPEPYVHCVPIMTGGSCAQGVRRFYSEHFINQIPRDAKVTPISRGSSSISVLKILRWCRTAYRLGAERYRPRRQLIEMDYHQLKDIGITREQAEQEGRKPIWKGPDSQNPVFSTGGGRDG